MVPFMPRLVSWHCYLCVVLMTWNEVVVQLIVVLMPLCVVFVQLNVLFVQLNVIFVQLLWY